MKRPTGVLIIGILGIIGGVLGILGSMTLMGVGGLAAAVGAGGVGGAAMAVGVIYLIISIFMLIMSIAFLSLKPWSWWGLLIVMAVNIVWAIIGMIIGGFVTSSLIGIIIDAIIIWYINTATVKQAFFGANAPDVLEKLNIGK